MFKTWLQPSPGPRTRLSVSFCVVLYVRTYVRTSFHVIDWTVMAVVVLLLRSRRPGIRCQSVFVAQLRVASAENSLMRNNDETYLEIFFVTMRYVNLTFYLLYLLTSFIIIIIIMH